MAAPMYCKNKLFLLTEESSVYMVFKNYDVQLTDIFDNNFLLKNDNPISPSVLFHWLDNLVQFFDYFTIAGTKNVLIHMTLHLNFAQYLLLFIKKIRLPPSIHINMFINLKDLRKYSYKEHCHTVQLSQLRDQILWSSNTTMALLVKIFRILLK